MKKKSTKVAFKKLQSERALLRPPKDDEDDTKLSAQMVLLSISATWIRPEISRSISSRRQTAAVYVELL